MKKFPPPIPREERRGRVKDNLERLRYQCNRVYDDLGNIDQGQDGALKRAIQDTRDSIDWLLHDIDNTLEALGEHPNDEER